MDFASIFVLALILKASLLWWLSLRQQKSVAACLSEPPNAFSDAIDLDGMRKAADYTAAKQALSRWSIALSTLVVLLWTIGGGLAWLDGLVFDITGLQAFGIAHGLTAILVFGLIGGLIDLPFSIYSTFVIEERFGFNRTSPGQFIIDLMQTFILSVVLGAVFIGVVLWLMEALHGTMWWLWAWMFFVAWNLALVAIWPRWLAPIFNRFTPLADGDLRQRIQSLLERCGFRADAVFVMDGSRRSAHGNAYFTGFGRNKRVVFFDTLLDTLNPEQTEAVLAHELGHSALKHIPKKLISMFVLWLPALWLIDYLLGANWFFASFGLSSANHLALLLFALVLPPFFFFIQPLTNYFSRKHEFEADAYAAKHSDRQSLETALVQLYKDNAVALTPDPWYSIWHDSHPPPLQRIARLKSLACP